MDYSVFIYGSNMGVGYCGSFIRAALIKQTSLGEMLIVI